MARHGLHSTRMFRACPTGCKRPMQRSVSGRRMPAPFKVKLPHQGRDALQNCRTSAEDRKRCRRRTRTLHDIVSSQFLDDCLDSISSYFSATLAEGFRSSAQSKTLIAPQLLPTDTTRSTARTGAGRKSRLETGSLPRSKLLSSLPASSAHDSRRKQIFMCLAAVD